LPIANFHLHGWQDQHWHRKRPDHALKALFEFDQPPRALIKTESFTAAAVKKSPNAPTGYGFCASIEKCLADFHKREIYDRCTGQIDKKQQWRDHEAEPTAKRKKRQGKRDRDHTKRHENEKMMWHASEEQPSRANSEDDQRLRRDRVDKPQDHSRLSGKRHAQTGKLMKPGGSA
jgi:hypothetical protein